MRRVFWLFLFVAGCTGSDGDPVRVAERFHGFRVASDHAGMHGLLTERDREAMPLDSFPVALPPALVQKVLGWRDARLESGSLLSSTAYLAAAERHPGIARAGDLDAARSMLLGAALVEALGVELRVLESFTGTRFLEGRVRNPTRTHIHLLRLIVRDGAGQEERVEVWGIDPDGTTPVRQLSRLRLGSVEHPVERIQTF